MHCACGLSDQYELHDLERDGFQADSSVVGVFRPAYMGHLHRIAEFINEMCDEEQLTECLKVGDGMATRRKAAAVEKDPRGNLHGASGIVVPVTPSEGGDAEQNDGEREGNDTVEGNSPQEEAKKEAVSPMELVEPPAVSNAETDEAAESAAAVAEPPAVVAQQQEAQSADAEETQAAGGQTVEAPPVPAPSPPRKIVTRESLADVQRGVFERWMCATSHEIMAGWRQLRAGGA